VTVVDALRKAYKQSIAENPTQITIQRTEKVNMGGYFDEVTSLHGPFTVRIFQQGSRIPHEISTLAGTKQIDKGWGLLADYQTDLRAGPNVKDEFDVPGLGHFVVVAVYPQKMRGEIIGYQVDLEKVD
jgi:hypothetical protein